MVFKTDRYTRVERNTKRSGGRCTHTRRLTNKKRRLSPM